MELGTRTALLLALQEGPGFGLDLIQRVSRRTGGRVRPNRGGVYIALGDLEEAGLVRSWARRMDCVGRPRRYYELTSSGIAAAERDRTALRGLVRAEAEGALPDARLMAERFLRSKELTLFALRIREAGRRAGL